MILTKFIIKMKLNSLVQNGPKIKQRCQTVAYRGSSIINNLVNVKLKEKKFEKKFRRPILTKGRFDLSQHQVENPRNLKISAEEKQFTLP